MKTGLFYPGFDTGNQRNVRLLTMIILLVAAILRLSGLGFSFSNDELSALVRADFDSFSDLVNHGFYVDGHPGGIQVFLYFWVKVFGMNEWAVRLPFALAGVLAVYFTIKVFTAWFGNNAGLLTGAFAAFLEFPLLYSQIARPYGPGLLFSMMFAWYWTRMLFGKKPGAGAAAGFALSAAACMYTHYFSFLLALIIGLTGLFFLKRDRILPYLLAGTGAALLFTPHIFITLNHLSIGGVGLWLDKPGNGWLAGHLLFVFNDSAWLMMLAASIMGTTLWLGRKELKLNRFHLFALLFFVLPFATGFLYSRAINPVLQHSVLIFSFPFLTGLIFSFAGALPRKSAGWMILFVLLTGTTHTTLVKRYHAKQHFGEFRGIALAIDRWNRDPGEPGITRAISINNLWYINHYLDQTPGGRTHFSLTDNRGGLYLDSLATLLDTCKTAYFAYAWTKPVPDETEDIIRARFPCICEKVDFGGLAAATLYGKKNTCRCNDADTLFRAAFDPGPGLPPGVCSMDSLEYSKGYDGTFAALSRGHNSELTATAEVYTETGITGAVMVVSFHDTSGETIHWLGAPLKYFARAGHWSTVRLTINPGKTPPESRMKMFLWNPGKEKMNIRKLSVTTGNKPL